MNFEQQLVASCLNSNIAVARINRARIKPKHFKDPLCRDLFAIIMEAYDNSAANAEHVIEYLRNKEYDSIKKALYSNKLKEMSGIDISGFDMSFKLVNKNRQSIEFKDALRATTEKLAAGGDISSIIASHQSRINSISRDEFELDPRNHFQNIRDRDQLRLEQGDFSRAITLHGVFAPWSHYFRDGFLPGTLTTIEAPTGWGKSILCANLLKMALSPLAGQVGKNCLYVYSENQETEAEKRLDAIILDKNYDSLGQFALSEDSLVKMEHLGKDGWGTLISVRAPLKKFTADTIRYLVDWAADEEGVNIDAVFIDSAAHMAATQSAVKTGVWWMDAFAIYGELKSFAEEYNLPVVATRQSKGSTVGSDVDAYSGSDGQKISELLDNIIAAVFHPQEDTISKIRKVKFTKNRGGILDDRLFRYKLLDSLNYISEDDWNTMFQPKTLSDKFKERRAPDADDED